VSADLLLRALWAILIVGILVGAYWAVNWLIIARVRGKNLGWEGIRSGIPAILYFTTPTCVPCKTIQRPALACLQEQLGDSLQVIEIDAAAQPDLANYWGVLSVPTTFIIDARGRPRRVNHGVCNAEKLQRQIEEVEQQPIAFETLRSMLRKVQNKRNFS
jgi:thiol-disulfide isomerase/thioredoxin